MAIKKRHSTLKSSGNQTRFTARQGQYLAFIDAYRKMNRRGPSEVDIASYFHVSPPSVNQMMVKLEEMGLIARQAGVPRSARVAIPNSEIPALEDDEPAGTVAEDRAVVVERGAAKLYTLEVFLIGGPVPKSFAGKVISRTIQIRGDQTLQDLHLAIFRAYDRWDEHAYEFEFGKGPHDPNGNRYVLPHMLDMRDEEPTIAGDVTRTTLDSLALNIEKPFGYWFDYGDDWWHQIDVQSIDEKMPRGQFPKIIKRVGESPPQYLDEE
jgi:hypothetical protein